MGNLKYKDYIGSVDYSEEDNCLYGKVLGMSKDVITYEGKTIEELKADFEAGVDSYLESCNARGIKPGKAYTGSFNVRLTPDIHSKIALMAQNAGISINAFIKYALEKQLGIKDVKDSSQHTKYSKA